MTYVDQEIAKEIFFSIARSKQAEVNNHVLSKNKSFSAISLYKLSIPK
jgi:hypothetical protein